MTSLLMPKCFHVYRPFSRRLKSRPWARESIQAVCINVVATARKVTARKSTVSASRYGGRHAHNYFISAEMTPSVQSRHSLLSCVIRSKSWQITCRLVSTVVYIVNVRIATIPQKMVFHPHQGYRKPAHLQCPRQHFLGKHLQQLPHPRLLQAHLQPCKSKGRFINI